MSHCALLMSALINFPFHIAASLHTDISRLQDQGETVLGGGHTVTGVERVILLVGFELIGEALACRAIWNEVSEQHFSPPLRL